ncbi:hypothetical protein J2T17_006338 [Paenibacillus mucilaginosus]|uniref:hypothetical protein n=1 Tax=Paenibacillus mucilaginosus TaxID=61624 RepID=UPI003D23C9A7
MLSYVIWLSVFAIGYFAALFALYFLLDGQLTEGHGLLVSWATLILMIMSPLFDPAAEYLNRMRKGCLFRLQEGDTTIELHNIHLLLNGRYIALSSVTGAATGFESQSGQVEAGQSFILTYISAYGRPEKFVIHTENTQATDFNRMAKTIQKQIRKAYGKDLAQSLKI